MTSRALDPEFEALLRHLRETRGFDFTAYKRSSLMRRVRRRMGAVGVEGYVDYVDYLEVHPEELAELFNTILINVTSFFRDPPAWSYLSEEIVPRIIARKGDNANYRIWCAACASGEEAYTIAMVMADALGIEEFKQCVKIYATDVDEDALATARQGIYTSRQVQTMPPEMLQRYFEPANGGCYAFRRDLRRSIIFGRHDLIQDAPISRIDLLISRNTLMYFNSDAQARILSRFFYALNEGGYLFLGKAETLMGHVQSFAPVELKFRIFAKPGVSQNYHPALPVPQAPRRESEERQPGERDQVKELAFQEDSLAQIVVDSSLRLVMANKKSRDVFGAGARDIGRPLHDLEVSYRPVELRSLIDQLMVDRRTMVLHEVAYQTSSGAMHWFDVHLVPLIIPEGRVLGVKISFFDVTRAHELADEVQQSRNDLETAYEELQSSNEELETTNEELHSTVEELETTNEELQSTNEELETINEELHSTNEELETLNSELRQRSTELNITNAFLQTILRSVNVGIAVVDANLAIQHWNNRAEDLWGVRSDEAQGRHLFNLDIGLPLQNLASALRDCLSAKEPGSETILDAMNRRGRPIKCRVTISPLLTADATIAGAVTLMDEVPAEPQAM